MGEKYGPRTLLNNYENLFFAAEKKKTGKLINEKYKGGGSFENRIQ